MSVDVSAAVSIDRPREEVAAFATDPANDPVWIGGIRSARPLQDGPIGVGSRVERTASFLGRRVEYVNEVVELEPGARLRMRSVQGPFPMEIAYSFDDVPGGTRVAIRVQGDAGRFYRLASPILGQPYGGRCPVTSGGSGAFSKAAGAAAGAAARRPLNLNGAAWEAAPRRTSSRRRPSVLAWIHRSERRATSEAMSRMTS